MFSGLNAEIARTIVEERVGRARQDRTARDVVRERRARKADRAQAVPAAPLSWTSPVRTLTDLAHASSAVRRGPVIEVGATTATDREGRVLYAGDPYRQTREALRAVGESLREAGADLGDVVRTRVFLKKVWQWEEAGRAHGEVFGSTMPVTTFVGAGGFVDSGILVAVEATAVVP